ncbi:carbonic anhydrase family protein [Helicobacter aurati]|uniref:Carbonic anhydrase n=1 Tax=Helicobacter aurati TaxID=137778 RepID=A0A3D8J8B6_9HELI|nr:carbonic anhydrase family protein [Helicobacter aurati]RDU73672.1 carbonic anhydrase family protein [Helicobacter aurati]
MKLFLKNTVIAALLLTFSYGADHHVHWSYSGSTGPKVWGDLDESYASCKTEKFQSPINILDSETIKVNANFSLKKTYANYSSNIVNNGHTVQVGFNGDNSLAFNDVDYKLIQLHFHTPSENQVNGKSYPAEVHLVHKDSEGNILVIGIFITEGKANPALQSIIKAVPNKVNVTKPFKDIALQTLLPQKMGYYEFQGSLTTPPCSGNVTWVVMQESIQASKSQLQALHKILKDNARDIQPLNGRTVNVSY